jgi:hypothetical protein
MNFAQRLQLLPSADHIAAIDLFDAQGHAVGHIANQPGQKGSVAVYAALAALYGGCITPAAAQLGLEWYAEHVADAQTHPGKHPNIDRLVAWAQAGTTYMVSIVLNKK